MVFPSAASDRPVALTREGPVLRLAFAYNPELVSLVKRLPYAHYDDRGTKSWTVQLCTQTVHGLRWMYAKGMVDRSVDDLLEPDETVEPCPPALLRRGSLRRPYVVSTAVRDQVLFAKLSSLSGAVYSKHNFALTYPDLAACALREFIDRGIIADPERLLTPDAIVVAFDPRDGEFKVWGDKRAQAAFDDAFPEFDVEAIWRERGMGVQFLNTLSQELYRGELARVGPGIQPSGLALDLFEHQRRNVAMAVERSALPILDEPGVGKTPSGIGAAAELLTRGLVERAVIVVPGSVRSQWAKEIARFMGMPVDRYGRPSRQDVVVVTGTPAQRTAAYEAAQTAQWLIVHYDVISSDLKQIEPLANDAVVVLDEAHRIKNPKAARTKAVRKLGLRAERRILLTGTPVETDPGEWFSLMSGFALPGIFGSYEEYGGRYQHPGAFGGYEGSRNRREMAARSRRLFVRHTKAQVAPHLPPLLVEPLLLDPDEKLAAAFRRAYRLARDEIRMDALERRGKAVDGHLLDEKDWTQVQTGADMTAYGLLRMMASSPRLVHLSQSPAAQALVAKKLVPDTDGPKLDELRELAAQMQDNGQRLVVFTSFKKMAELICERFDTDGVRWVRYTGDTSMRVRDEIQTAFNTPPTEGEPGPTVFVATDAAAEGLNLGRVCTTLVNFDLPWTPTRLIQRSNRIHRIDGTGLSYRVINLLLAGTVEPAILQVLEGRADLQDAYLSESGGRDRSVGTGGGLGVFREAVEVWDNAPEVLQTA
jgi:SNF2 family DNA or RNA helicase